MDGKKPRYYLRKQRSCFYEVDQGASFIRPDGCKNCDTLHGDPFEVEICIEMKTKEKMHDNDVELETMKYCPYEVSSVSIPKSNATLKMTCKKFNAHGVPYFNINYKRDESRLVS